MPYCVINQIKFFYEIHGNGEPLVFIHGLGASTKDWEAQIAFFEKKYQVISFDLRGHGKTDKPNEGYSVVQFANDAVTLIKALLPEQKVNIIGHSLGGMVSFQLALDAPSIVKTLTIINSAPAVILPRMRDHLFFYMRVANIKLFGMHALANNLAKLLFPKPSQQPLREAFISRWSSNDPDAYLNALRMFRGWNVMHRLGEIKCPTLIITADHDYSPVTFKEFYTKLLPNAQLVVIKDSLHMTNLDQPEALNNALESFFNKQGF